MIFYFSGTGNTRWVARTLAEATGEQLVDIADEMRGGPKSYALGEGERLGFCYPTHGWQPPHIFRQFIWRSRFKVRPDTYCFALTTCGDSTGKSMTILNKELEVKGIQATAQFTVIMPESYVCLPFMYTDSPEREQQKKEAARQQLQHIISVVSERRQGVEELTKGPVPRFFTYVVGHYFNRKMITDRKFMVDEDVCTQCGLCSKVCPVDNIKGTPPQWQHNGHCTCCLACYHHCPVHAINYGERTRKRGQYYFK